MPNSTMDDIEAIAASACSKDALMRGSVRSSEIRVSAGLPNLPGNLLLTSLPPINKFDRIELIISHDAFNGVNVYFVSGTKQCSHS